MMILGYIWISDGCGGCIYWSLWIGVKLGCEI